MLLNLTPMSQLNYSYWKSELNKTEKKSQVPNLIRENLAKHNLERDRFTNKVSIWIDTLELWSEPN